MRIKIWSTLFLLSLASCAEAPPFPKIEYKYFVTIDKKATPHCAKFKIISSDPLIIDKGVEVSFSECDQVSGIKALDEADVLLWKDQIQKWAKEHCKS